MSSKKWTYPNACNVWIPCATPLAPRSIARLCKRTQATRNELEMGGIINSFMLHAQVEVRYILLTVAKCEIWVVDTGREEVSPDIICRVTSENDAFQPSAVARGAYRSQDALGKAGIVRTVSVFTSVVDFHFIWGALPLPVGSGPHLIRSHRQAFPPQHNRFTNPHYALMIAPGILYHRR